MLTSLEAANTSWSLLYSVKKLNDLLGNRLIEPTGPKHRSLSIWDENLLFVSKSSKQNKRIAELSAKIDFLKSGMDDLQGQLDKKQDAVVN